MESGWRADKARAVSTERSIWINFIDTAIFTVAARRDFLGRPGQPPRASLSRNQAVLPVDGPGSRPSRAQVKSSRCVAAQAEHRPCRFYQCHRYDSETPWRRRWRADRAVESGKTRYIGFSEWPADKIRAAIDLVGMPFASSQHQLACYGESRRRR